jgi:small-conductance mechanosensitive channel
VSKDLLHDYVLARRVPVSIGMPVVGGGLIALFALLVLAGFKVPEPFLISAGAAGALLAFWAR